MNDSPFYLERRGDALYARQSGNYWRLMTTWEKFVSWFATPDLANAKLGQMLTPLCNPATSFSDSNGWKYLIVPWDQSKHSYPPPDIVEQKPLLDWYNQPIQSPAKSEGNPMVETEGPCEDARVKCKNCTHLVGIATSRTIYKCDLRKNTHGTKTDHSPRWPACTQFKLREGPIRRYDGRK